MLGHAQLLRESGTSLDAGIDISGMFEGDRPVGVSGEVVLSRFIDAALTGRTGAPISELDALIEDLGEDAALASVAAIAAFEMSNRVIDTAHLRLTPRMKQLAVEFGIDTDH